MNMLSSKLGGLNIPGFGLENKEDLKYSYIFFTVKPHSVLHVKLRFFYGVHMQYFNMAFTVKKTKWGFTRFDVCEGGLPNSIRVSIQIVWIWRTVRVESRPWWHSARWQIVRNTWLNPLVLSEWIEKHPYDKIKRAKYRDLNQLWLYLTVFYLQLRQGRVPQTGPNHFVRSRPVSRVVFSARRFSKDRTGHYHSSKY
jgi:hypothetical protein